MDKVIASANEAIADLADGATVALAGFGLGHRFPNTLIRALRERGTKSLTLVCNSLGGPGEKGQLLVENNQVKKLMASFSVRPGMRTAAEEQIVAGKLEVELIPQGILVERCRAGGAGIPAFYSPTAADTELAAGKELRYFNGKAHVLEHAINLDFALLSAYRADRAGNVQFRGGARNFNPSFAKAAKVAIVEVDEVLEVGELPPEQIDLPGIFIHRVVKNEIH
ncbi:MAG: CoA transferase subunit A, partial [Betaproteobacteria bacterium]